jgi:hypothetical protein
MWAQRIADCKNNMEKVDLHVERWKAWDAFIYKFANGRTIVKEVLDISIDENEREFQEALEAKGIRWSKKIVGDVVFDASFGSLNSTSDLDINVLSPNTKVLKEWISFLKKWQSKHPNKTFTNYYDSNFYFEPCDESLQSLKLLLVNMDFEWTTPESYMKEFEAVKRYTTAYLEETAIDDIHPNPKNMNSSDEIRYYTKCRVLANAFSKAYYSKDVKRIRETYLNFALCTIEGIVSIPALAICGVFGPEIMQRYIRKRDIYPKALQIGVYEMLCNLRMHAHRVNGELRFKSKYANRLVNLLRNNAFICEEDKVSSFDKTNEASMENIKLAMVYLLDYLDGEDCNIGEYKVLTYDINKVIKTMELKITGKTIGNLPRQVSIEKMKFQLRF